MAWRWNGSGLGCGQKWLGMTHSKVTHHARTYNIGPDRSSRQRFDLLSVLFFLTGFAPAIVSLALVGAASVVGILCIPATKKQLSRVPREAVYFLIAALYTLTVTALSWGGQANLFSFFAEGKVAGLLFWLLFCVSFSERHMCLQKEIT